MNVRTRIAIYSLLIGGGLFCLASALVANWNSPLVDPTPTPTCTASPPCTATPVPDCSVKRPTPTGTAAVDTQDCSAIPWPTSPAPTITPIPNAFQPSAGAPLAWRPFEPTGNPAPTPPWPTILVIHGGGFKKGAPFPHYLKETQFIIDTATDLASAGYYVLVVAYRLAPPNIIPGQTCHDLTSGFAPWQEYDVEAMIKAANADSRVDRIGVIGGSGGATHAIWAALDTRTDAPMAWPGWRPELRPNAAVGLSGAYDLSDRTPENYCNGGDPVETIKQVAENYTMKSEPGDQRDRSVVHLLYLPTFDPTQVRPMQIYNTQHDSMAYHQIIDLQCALQDKHVNPALYTITTLTAEPYCEQHAFGYWLAIKDTVIQFFDCQLKGINCPSPTPSR